MQREGVEGGGAESHPLGHASHEQEGADRRLVEQVVVDGEDVDSRRVDPPRDRLVGLRLLVGQKADPELARYVSSSVTRERSARRSILITTRSSGSGQQTRAVPLEPVLVGEAAHLCGQQRHHRLQRVQAEVSVPPESGRGTTRSPRTSRRPRGRTPSAPRSARLSRGGRRASSPSPAKHRVRSRRRAAATTSRPPPACEEKR